MVAKYLAALEALIIEVASDLPLGGTIKCRHFFSGAAAYAANGIDKNVKGQIFMTWTPAGLALKLPESARAELTEMGGEPLRYFPKAPVKKDYVVVPDSLIDDPTSLGPWIRDSIAFAQAG